jgi:hypothetical protein
MIFDLWNNFFLQNRLSSIYTKRQTMRQQEARAVIDALEKGQAFEFHSYAADTRETLVHDVSVGCFVLTRYNAYDPGEPERRTFTMDELQLELEASFCYASFGLPPVHPMIKKRK